jgi:uncharacterized protein with HEPN domain
METSACGLRDILRTIAGIQQTVGRLGFDVYVTVWSIKHASERGIEIISEALSTFLNR